MKWLSLPNCEYLVLCLNKLNTLALYEEIFVHNIYGKTGVEIKDNDVIFDVGANIGMFSIWARNQAAHLKLFCFEPSPETFEVLNQNVPFAWKYQEAVLDKSGATSFTHYPRLPELSTVMPDCFHNQERVDWEKYIENWSSVKVLPGVIRQHTIKWIRKWLFKSQTLQVPAITLTEAVKRANVDRIDLLKIDVEKSELRVLRGINEDTWKKIKQIIVECYDDGEVSLKLVKAELTANGFEPIVIYNTMFPELKTPLVVGIRKSSA